MHSLGVENQHTIYAGTDVMSSGQQGRARRRADGGPGIEIVETHAVRGETVERRCLHRAVIAADVLVAQIIGKQHDNVRSLPGSGGSASHQ